MSDRPQSKPTFDRREFLIAGGSAIAAGILASTSPAATASSRDITFFIASDMHYGLNQDEDNEKLNKDAIRLLNNLAGVDFPKPEFGKIPETRAVLVPGDLTDSSARRATTAPMESTLCACWTNR